jgi:predicted ATPase/class 3 adenylate cyclase
MAHEGIEERVVAARAASRTALPAQSTPFLGRERELAEVGDLLARDDVRLVTLTGPGGAGKTRLAIQAAAERAAAYADGVVFVALAPVRDPALIAATVTEALGLADQPGVAPADLLREHLAERELLLLLDNLEQIASGAPLIGGLVAACPALTVLAISREALRVAAEREYPVPPLEESEAVQLFLERARAVRPRFTADGQVADICRRLDHLPLAIELAAARVRVLSPAQILARLDRRLPLLTGGPRDVPERQRTLRAAIDWSHDLMGAGEQRLFAHLAVFAGGFSLDAAERVAGADLDRLQALIDKNLVRREGERYGMLETIREYALERLEARGEAARLRARHAAGFLELAERAAPELHRARSDRLWLEVLEEDRDNLRAALRWLVHRGEGTGAQRLAGALCAFWHDRGPVSEACEWIERALALSAPDAIRAVTLCRGSLLAAYGGDLGLARAWAAEGLPLARAAGDRLSVIAALTALGGVEVSAGRRADGMRLIEEALEVARESGDDWAIAATLVTILSTDVDLDPARAVALADEAGRLRGISASARAMIDMCRGFVAEQHGDVEAAISLYRDSIAVAREIGFDKACAALENLGFLELRLGDLDEAREHLHEALDLAGASGARGMAAGSIAYLALLAGADGDPLRAALLRGAVERYRRTVAEVPLTEFIDGTFDGYLEAARAAAGEAAWAEAYERGTALSLDEVRAAVTEDRRRADLRAAADGTLTIVFSDIEGSTALTERLGDRRWLEVLRAHDAFVCREVERHRGRVVKSRGDGFMLAFRRPAEALSCAIGIQRACARWNQTQAGAALRVRIGLHTGPAIPHQGDYYGGAVNLAARIADRAAGGEILVSAAVRDAVGPRRDCGFALSAELELKGLSGRHAAYAVTWAPEPAAAPVR